MQEGGFNSLINQKIYNVFHTSTVRTLSTLAAMMNILSVLKSIQRQSYVQIEINVLLVCCVYIRLGTITLTLVPPTSLPKLT